MMEQDPAYLLSLISRIHTAVSSLIREELEKQGLTELVSSHGNILWQLASHGSLSMKELSSRVNRDKSTVTVLVRKLETAGYVRRKADENDSRVARICLTEKGAQYTQRMDLISQTLVHTCYAGFGQEEKETAYRLLQKIAANFDLD